MAGKGGAGMNRQQIIRFAAFVTVLAVLLGYVVYHRSSTDLSSLPAAATNQSHPAAKAGSGAGSNGKQQLANYFENYRAQRDRTMSQEIATLKSLIDNAQVSEQARSEALQTVARDTQELKQEQALEGLLSAQGFPLNAVTVTANSCVVVVGQAQLTQQEVARIANAAMQVTHLPPEDVVIMPKGSA
jgi:hypothetical protein